MMVLDHGQGQGALAAGAKLQPVIGLFGQADAPGIHDDDLFRLLYGPQEHGPAHAVGRAGFHDVAAPVEDAGRGLSPETVDVAHGQTAEGDGAADDTGQIAEMAGIDEVGRAEGVGETDGELGVGPSGALGYGQELRPGFLADAVEAIRHLREGLLPGDALPAVLSASTGTA